MAKFLEFARVRAVLGALASYKPERRAVVVKNSVRPPLRLCVHIQYSTGLQDWIEAVTAHSGDELNSAISKSSD